MAFKVEITNKGRALNLKEFYESMPNQKYRRIYEKLIYRAQWRIADKETYWERHHIIPKCLGGSNYVLNIVKLTAEEHYLVHQILVRIYPKNKKLIHSAILMASKSPDVKRSSNKVYGWLRRKMSEVQIGIKRSPEATANIARANIARCKDVPLSEEHRAQISKAGKGRIVREETRELLRTIQNSPEAVEWRIKSAKTRTGMKRSPEICAAMSARQKGRVLPPQWRANISAATKGKKRPPFTAEHRANMSKVRKGKIFFIHDEASRARVRLTNSTRIVTEETRLKMSDSAKNMTDERRSKIGAASKISRQRELELGIGMYSPESIAKRSASIKASWDRRKAAALEASLFEIEDVKEAA